MSNERTVRARAKSWGLGETKTGKEQVAVEFEYPDESGTHSITWYGYFTDGTWKRTVDSLRTCGWEGDDLGNLEGLDRNEVDLVIGEEEYQGKLYTKVQWVNRPGSLNIKTPLAGEKLKAFTAAMRNNIRALAASEGKSMTPRPAAPAPEAQGDIPF